MSTRRGLTRTRLTCGALALMVFGVSCSSDSTGPSTAALLTLSAPSAASIAALQAGSTVQLTAVVTDQKGNALSGQTLAWHSSDTTHAKVSASGLVTGGLIGSASITATTGVLTSNSISVTVVAGAPTTLAKVQDVAAGIVVGAATSISVAVTDAAGNVVPGAAIGFVIFSSGGGSVSSPTATSDANGVAGVQWTMGTTPITQTVSATIAGNPNSQIIFTATPVAGPAALITKVSKDSAGVPTGFAFDSIVALVTDQFSNPKSGTTVNFAVKAGGGSVSPVSVVTGSNGRAAAQWTMGASTGSDTATATAPGLASPTVTFATTTFSVASITVSGPRFLVVDSGATVALAVVARDAGGNTVSGAQVTTTSRSTVASVSNNVITGTQRGTTFVVAVSTVNPKALDSVMVIVGVPGFPVLTTDLARVDVKSDTVFTITLLMNMRNSPDKLGSGTVQVVWDTAFMKYQADADGSSGVGASVNNTTAAGGSLILDFAASNGTGFSGTVQLRTITFHVVGGSGHTSALHLAISDLSGGATTFDNLLPNTVAASYPLVIR